MDMYMEKAFRLVSGTLFLVKFQISDLSFFI